MSLFFQQISTPVGVIYVTATKDSLRAITFESNWVVLKKKLGLVECKSNPIIAATQNQLCEYFAKQRTSFNLPLLLTGTQFQQQAWRALLQIPYAETRSYSQQAGLINNPKAVRAVGRANSLNPLPIVVPCHRVIGKTGKLTGFAGGLEIKRYLLSLEGQEL